MKVKKHMALGLLLGVALPCINVQAQSDVNRAIGEVGAYVSSLPVEQKKELVRWAITRTGEKLGMTQEEIASAIDLVFHVAGAKLPMDQKRALVDCVIAKVGSRINLSEEELRSFERIAYALIPQPGVNPAVAVAPIAEILIELPKAEVKEELKDAGVSSAATEKITAAVENAQEIVQGEAPMEEAGVNSIFEKPAGHLDEIRQFDRNSLRPIE